MIPSNREYANSPVTLIISVQCVIPHNAHVGSFASLQLYTK